MSVGTPHRRPNLKHPAELAGELGKGDASALMARWRNIDLDHDVADLAGYNTGGTTRFLDRDFARAILDPENDPHGIGPIDTGLSPEDTITAILEHEGVEKVLLDADNDINSYPAAHEFATTAEHEKVRKLGGVPHRYEAGLAKAIAFCAKKKLEQVPADFACAPMLDDPDRADRRVLKDLRGLGVVDAFKQAKKSVAYDRSTRADRCDGCANWQGSRSGPLALCAQVDGLVRADRWCKRFEAMEAGDGEELDQRRGQEQGRAAPEPGSPGGPEDPGLQSGGGDALQEPQDPQAGEPRQDA